MSNPYKMRADYSFWKKSVANVMPFDIDPVVEVPFKIGSGDRVATAGSCFAQNIARALRDNGFNYYVTERAPRSLSAAEAEAKNYAVYSARYGNVYTTRQLRQLIDRAYGRFLPDIPVWRRPDGMVADPFRPQIDPAGFARPDDVEQAAEEHLAAVREMLETLDVFVFTLGLTEGWVSKASGAVLPIAPGVVAGSWDPDLYSFVNFGVADVVADLRHAIEALRAVNPRARVILTVSPVPLIATFVDRHVLVSNTYSKSVLRVAAEEVAGQYDDILYFPSFEIINSQAAGSMYFEDDLRSVSASGVQHVMRVFFRHLTDAGDETSSHDARLTVSREIENVGKIVCDEEFIERSLTGS